MFGALKLLGLLILLPTAWLVWQTPAPAPTPATIRIPAPAKPDSGHEVKQDNSLNEAAAESTPLWRIVTRRVITRDGLKALRRLLAETGLQADEINRKEDITLHAFDDITTFKSKQAAVIGSKPWIAHGIETSIIKTAEEQFLIGLGRFYQTKYAESTQMRLRTTGIDYRYEKRIIAIPTWRFTFPPTNKFDAEKLWAQLHRTGTVMPVLMQEESFQALYGSDNQATSE